MLTNAILWGTTLWGIFCQRFIYSVGCVYICILMGYCVNLYYFLWGTCVRGGVYNLKSL